MKSILVVILIIAILVGVVKIMEKLTKNMKDDYMFMRSQAEQSDYRPLNYDDKVNTAMVGNEFVNNMVEVSMLSSGERRKDD